jgi:hypothetical protein
MKKYSSNRAQKGKTAYRTPSRWLAGQPEAFKKRPGTKLTGKTSPDFNRLQKPKFIQ